MELDEASVEGSTGEDPEGSLTAPQFHRPSLDGAPHYGGTVQKLDNIEIERLLNLLNQIDLIIQKEIEAIEHYDITIQIITFKIYEATREFKLRITEVKEERNRILTSIDNQSELSLVLNDLDKKISALEQELSDKIGHLNQQKLEFQEKTENVIAKLDEDVAQMTTYVIALKKELTVKTGISHKAQTHVMNEKYASVFEKYHENLLKYEKLELNGWRFPTSEVRLAEILEQNGLKFTPSARLLTRSGNLVTFQEAKDLGYLKEISTSLDKVLQFLTERSQQQKALEMMRSPSRTSVGSSKEGSTIASQMSSEDVKYLKQFVGKPLTLALAEITVKQPRDPIHYLGHYLFKYRYNQELEELQKKEIEELTEQRKALAQERWKKFVESEAKDAVLDMILRAEQMAYQNELKRIEDEQILAAQEGEEEVVEDPAMKALMEEAKDKFL